MGEKRFAPSGRLSTVLPIKNVRNTQEKAKRSTEEIEDPAICVSATPESRFRISQVSQHRFRSMAAIHHRPVNRSCFPVVAAEIESGRKFW